MSKKKNSPGLILPIDVQLFIILWGHRYLCADPNGHAL